jgi:hypothetical protein
MDVEEENNMSLLEGERTKQTTLLNAWNIKMQKTQQKLMKIQVYVWYYLVKYKNRFGIIW